MKYIVKLNPVSNLSLAVSQIKGEAEAFATLAKGRADAEQMAKKAEAFNQYKEGAMVDMLLEKLPLVSPSYLLHPVQFCQYRIDYRLEQFLNM